MSLGKLLTTGKSLVGLHDSNARYELRKGALPKFESAKNPFAAKAAAEQEPQLPKLSPEEVAASNLKKTQSLPVLGQPAAKPAADPVAQSAPVEPAPAKPSPAVDSWLKKLNPLVWFANRKSAEPKSAIPRFNKDKAPVQGELSLDNIKVMRNDLSDADVEIVTAQVPVKARAAKKPAVAAIPAAPEAATQASAAAMAIPDLPPASAVWEFLGERILNKD